MFLGGSRNIQHFSLINTLGSQFGICELNFHLSSCFWGSRNASLHFDASLHSGSSLYSLHFRFLGRRNSTTHIPFFYSSGKPCLNSTFLGQQKLGNSLYSTPLNSTSLSSGGRKSTFYTSYSGHSWLSFMFLGQQKLGTSLRVDNSTRLDFHVMFLVIGSLTHKYPSTSLALSCLHFTFLGQQKLNTSPGSTPLNFTSLSSGGRKAIRRTALSQISILFTSTRHFWGSRNPDT
ncbi:hypothetical protein BDP81DRAFT_169667 [Colletotrichum phormii]|uniref:Uncharacterized protein n=1 Tax=Colletotrichum phormii TaxID=359342 RepID=A0AAI9ZE73_9PEZI|nr:uncharacterized protein BDP81DRAFT_169667 [Colletotrichum phormii]KAK1621955.1 hypothetical protein BDP81DRAFT_169667 [Colletotrichum phormii]